MKKISLLFIIVTTTIGNTWAADTKIKKPLNDEAKRKLFRQAIKDETVIELEELLKKYPAIINKPAPDYNKSTLLHEVLWEAPKYADKGVSMVNALLQARADVNLQDGTTETPLHVAAYLSLADVTRILISKGAKVNAENKLKRTPLEQAIHAGNKDIAQALLDAGAKFNKEQDWKWARLHKCDQDRTQKVLDFIENYVPSEAPTEAAE